jgi:hypothetical protein
VLRLGRAGAVQVVQQRAIGICSDVWSDMSRKLRGGTRHDLQAPWQYERLPMSACLSAYQHRHCLLCQTPTVQCPPGAVRSCCCAGGLRGRSIFFGWGVRCTLAWRQNMRNARAMHTNMISLVSKPDYASSAAHLRATGRSQQGCVSALCCGDPCHRHCCCQGHLAPAVVPPPALPRLALRAAAAAAAGWLLLGAPGPPAQPGDGGRAVALPGCCCWCANDRRWSQARTATLLVAEVAAEVPAAG